MTNEGSEVIQASNRRVAAAKKADAGAARNLQGANAALKAAQKAVEAAQKDHDEATKELKDAEQSQKTAQQKWEVVDLVQDDEDGDDEEKRKSSNEKKKRAEASSDSKAKAVKKARSDFKYPEEVTVEGCGVAEVNGIYKRDGWIHGAPQYLKEGQWEGEDVKFRIHRHTYYSTWSIQYEQVGHTFKSFYFNRNKSSAPPSHGWEVYLIVDGPPPILRSLE